MIRSFEIWNEKFNELEAYLYYDTENDKYSMKLLENYDGKHPDVFFDILQMKGTIDVPQNLVNMWVQGRVFPPNRQGSKGMLQKIGLKEYDLFKLLLHYEGRNQMDSSYIKEITQWG